MPMNEEPRTRLGQLQEFLKAKLCFKTMYSDDFIDPCGLDVGIEIIRKKKLNLDNKPVNECLPESTSSQKIAQ